MRDMLLQIDTYAEPISPAAIDQAIALAKLLEGRISALATHIDIRVPDNWLAERLLNVSRLADAEEAQSQAAGQASLSHFEKSAVAAGVFGEAVMVRSSLHGVGPCVARHARTRDLCLVPIAAPMDSQRSVAEDVLFGSGRPLLVFNPETAPLPAGSLGRVTIAWDGGRCAARAVADAMPLLLKTNDVRVLTILGEKASAVSGLSVDLVRHLGCFGIKATIDEVDGRHQSINASIDAYIDTHAPQLMVMGGYGSPKLKEFVLGGATEHVLNRLRVPTLLSH